MVELVIILLVFAAGFVCGAMFRLPQTTGGGRHADPKRRAEIEQACKEQEQREARQRVFDMQRSLKPCRHASRPTATTPRPPSYPTPKRSA